MATRRRSRTAGHVPDVELAGHIAVLTQRIAGDLRGLGASTVHSTAIRNRLLVVCRELLSVQRELGHLRGRSVRQLAQSVAASGTGAGTDLKIHIGGGSQRMAGWVTVDLPPAEVPINVLWGLPWKKGAARFVFCSHMLEHLEFPRAAVSFLGEVARVLRKGGVLRLVVPDIEKYLLAYAKKDRAFFRGRRRVWPNSAKCPTTLSEVLWYAGAGSRPDDFFGHRFGYDFETLKLVLREAGFRRIERSGYMSSRYPELRVDSTSPHARARVRGVHYSLFVDAVR